MTGTGWAIDASPLVRARLAGVFYVLTGGTAFAAFVRNKVIVSGDALATAQNILASESLYRWGLVADVLGVASYIVFTALLYSLLKPVNRTLALLAAFLSLVGVATQAASMLGQFAALLFLTDIPTGAALDAAQREALALLSLRLGARGFDIACVFFGCYCAVLGYLIFRSTFFPRLLGVLVTIAGLALMANSLTMFLAPHAAHMLAPILLSLDGIGELSLLLWLLIIGIDVPKWRASATDVRRI
jgi:hypothetical protein